MCITQKCLWTAVLTQKRHHCVIEAFPLLTWSNFLQFFSAPFALPPNSFCQKACWLSLVLHLLNISWIMCLIGWIQMFLPQPTKESMHCVTVPWWLFEVPGKICVKWKFVSLSSGESLADMSCSWYRKAGLEAESKAAQSCMELQCFMDMCWCPCTLFLTALCGEGWGVRQERFVWGIGDVDIDWLGNYPNLGFSIHWFPGQQGVTDA